MIRIDKMGKRRLAYTVRRFHDGIYVLMVVEGGGPVIHELERRLRVTEPVIKFLTVRVDEEQKRLDKIKKLRDSKKKMSAQPAAAPTPAPTRSRSCASSGGRSSSNGVKAVVSGESPVTGLPLRKRHNYWPVRALLTGH